MYMSMTGARDISLMQTPPKERMAIDTIITKNDDNIIRKALIRELNREGQSFFLHNRVATIQKVYERLKKLVPEASIEVAHGQMPTSILETVMHNFTTGKFDILLCTTIIESGMDIPRVNTIIIDRADRFGIAELYQLRGRVGRSNRKAYAYLLLPQHGHIEPDAQRRIAAVRKFSGLSAGYNLAMRDLEIRGAGNLLGASQSGHINAIGFGLYCQLLNRTVAQLKNKPLPPLITVTINLDFIDFSAIPADETVAATITYNYIEDERLRIDTYRRIAEAATIDAIKDLRGEIIDRFGKPPQSITRLLKLAELRVLAANRGIISIETQGTKLMLRTREKFLMENKRFPHLTTTTPDAKIKEIAARIQTFAEWSLKSSE
jgi:transcription-repair coupling factor (superfamily II helicase)